MRLFRRNDSGSKVLIEDNMYLPHLDCERNVWIYLPPNYNDNKKLRFPVLYMNDGQNLFDDSGSGSWELDARLDEYYADTGLTQIIVGIDNGCEERMAEYLPWDKGAAYAMDWRETIYPFICSKFRVSLHRDLTAFGGSSLGATILLEFIANHQDLIRSYTFFSPAVEVEYEKTMEMVEQLSFDQHCKLYFDIGTGESTSQECEELDDCGFVERATAMAQRMKEKSGMPSVLVLDKLNIEHSEDAWTTRFLMAVDWLKNESNFYSGEEELTEIIIEDEPYFD